MTKPPPLRFTVLGKPVPKGRPRFNRKTGAAYTPPETRKYEASVTWAALAAISQYGVLNPQPWDPSLIYDVRALVCVSDLIRRDCENIVKACSDACNMHVYKDDVQIKHMRWAWQLDRANPRVEFEVRVINEEELEVMRRELFR